MSANVNIKQLLEAGAHFGHQTRRWNPKMKKFIFGARNGIHIIDLQKTVKKFKEAVDFVREIVLTGGNILFVGTKKQAEELIFEEATRCGMFYVNHRWLGGMLTNFETIKKGVRRLIELEKMKQEGALELFSKKEASLLEKERLKLERTLGGVKKMDNLPQAVFLVDIRKEKIALHEVKCLGIPIIAIVDTNCDPEGIDYPIPSNDDAIRTLRLIISSVANMIVQTKEELSQKKKVEMEKDNLSPQSAEEQGGVAKEVKKEQADSASDSNSR